jgi:hypothetical protein
MASLAAGRGRFVWMVRPGNPPVLRNPRRAANASIGGYRYQFAYTAVRWLECDESTLLYCEGNEDLDVVEGAGVNEVQLKNERSKFGQGSASTRKILTDFGTAFCEHHRASRRCSLIFRTTAELAGDENATLGLWMRGEPYAPDALREELNSLMSLSEPDAMYLERDEHWEDFVNSVRWAFREPSLEKYEQRLLNMISSDPRARGLAPRSVMDSMIAQILARSSAPRVEQRELNSLSLDILLNDLWLSKGVDDWSVNPGQQRALVSTKNDSRGLVCVVVFVDDAVQAAADFKLACDEAGDSPQPHECESLVELAAVPQGIKFLSGTGFDAYAALDCSSQGSRCSGRDLQQTLAQHVAARGVLEIASAPNSGGFAAISRANRSPVIVTEIPAESLEWQLTNLVADAVLDSWMNQRFSPVMNAIHRKLRLVADLRERAYFTQDSPPPWL